MELAYGNVLCFQCGDYVYDSELLEVAQGNDTKAAASLDVSAVYTPWSPTPRELQLLQANPCVRSMVKDSTIGQLNSSYLMWCARVKILFGFQFIATEII